MLLFFFECTLISTVLIVFGTSTSDFFTDLFLCGLVEITLVGRDRRRVPRNFSKHDFNVTGSVCRVSKGKEMFGDCG